MPVATIDPNVTERFELKSAPADPTNPSDEAGYVVLRALPYGMKLTRRDKATKMKMQGQQGKNTESSIELESMNEWAVAFDFRYCIQDHNLTDQNGTKLDFSNPMILKSLNPKVGSEIEKLINGLNEDEDELMLEDFLRPSRELSTDAASPLLEDSSDTLET